MAVPGRLHRHRRPLGDDRFAHNAALVQTGNCFEMLPANGGDGTSWIGSWVEDELNTWIWPLDAEIGADGHLWLFLAAVRNERGDGAAAGAEPVGTWRARYRLPDLELIDLEPAEDASNELFGYSIVSDDDWTYLYGHCYRQFAPRRRVRPVVLAARLPRPGARAAGSTTSRGTGRRTRAGPATGSARTPVLSGRRRRCPCPSSASATSTSRRPTRTTGSAATSSSARPIRPQGPWREAVRYTPADEVRARATTTAPSSCPGSENGKVVIAQSNNAWDMQGDAFADASRYRISVNAVSVPGVPRNRSVRALIEADQTTRGQVEAPVGEPDVQPVTIGASRAVDGPSDGVLVAGRALVLGLMGLVALAASLGFARSARRIDPGRRHRAVARLRASGPTRSHGGSEHDRLAAVDEDAVLEVGAHGTGEHGRLEVAAGSGERGDVVAVADADRLLVDDRPLVEVVGGVVGGRADQLDATVVGLAVRVGPGEGREERVVDVDDPVRVGGDGPRRQDAHVARQHDELDVVLGERRPGRSAS